MKLEVQNLYAGYPGNAVLTGIEFTVTAGEIVTLLGPNGCGKSTLLKVIGRLLKPKSGQVLLDGRQVHSCDTADLARKMAILPQFHDFAGEITVRELVGFGRFPHRTGLGMMNANDRQIIEEALKLTELDKLGNRRVATLSGGERQRTWIAMTIAQQPEILLLDEPTTFLDVHCQLEIIEMIRNLNQQMNLTILMVLHDLNLAARCSDRLIMLKDGQVRYTGTPQEIMTPAIIREIFEVEPEIVTGKDGTPYFIPTKSVKPPA